MCVFLIPTGEDKSDALIQQAVVVIPLIEQAAVVNPLIERLTVEKMFGCHLGLAACHARAVSVVEMKNWQVLSASAGAVGILMVK